jgi:transcriptional regulator with XRE-family HTH domain
METSTFTIELSLSDKLLVARRCLQRQNVEIWREVGVERNTWIGYENGETIPTSITVYRISELTGNFVQENDYLLAQREGPLAKAPGKKKSTAIEDRKYVIPLKDKLAQLRLLAKGKGTTLPGLWECSEMAINHYLHGRRQPSAEQIAKFVQRSDGLVVPEDFVTLAGIDIYEKGSKKKPGRKPKLALVPPHPSMPQAPNVLMVSLPPEPASAEDFFDML